MGLLCPRAWSDSLCRASFGNERREDAIQRAAENALNNGTVVFGDS